MLALPSPVQTLLPERSSITGNMNDLRFRTLAMYELFNLPEYSVPFTLWFTQVRDGGKASSHMTGHHTQPSKVPLPKTDGGPVMYCPSGKSRTLSHSGSPVSTFLMAFRSEGFHWAVECQYCITQGRPGCGQPSWPTGSHVPMRHPAVNEGCWNLSKCSKVLATVVFINVKFYKQASISVGEETRAGEAFTPLVT